MNKPAAIYARVSSDRQKENHTIASQTAALIEYAQTHGYSVPPEWIFQDEGYSGAVLVRPGLEALRDLAAEGQIVAALIYSPDRMSRKYAYQVLLSEELARCGVELIFLKSPAGATAEDQLLVQFQSMIAEYERAQIAERSRRGKRHMAQRGGVNVLSGAPYGYRYVRKSDTSAAFYEVIEAEARVVRTVFEIYTQQGLSINAIARLLNERQIATRTGKGRWERSTVWGLLRNPAYRGTACYGKTEARPRQRITRPFRQRKAWPSRDSAGHERPRTEWIEIPVPALVSEEVFALAQEQLEKNKRHAPRRTVEPTLLQGILVCEQCGYALYRTSTRTSKQKLHYYRCLGSDGYRRLRGPVCTSRPIRQDCLDRFVWSEIIRLLEDPALIQAEIDRRRAAARYADPLRKRQEELRREQVRIEKNSERLVTAYQEGLVTLPQLRQRIPALQKQAHAVGSELQSLEMAAVNEEKYLQLTNSLGSFRSKLRARADTLDIAARQQILRLVVREVLVGADTITVRHSIQIPQSGPGSSGAQSPPSAVTRSRPNPSYLLRSGSNHRPLRSPFQSRNPLSIFDYSRFEPFTDQSNDPLIGDPVFEKPEHPPVIDFVEERADVGIYDPVHRTALDSRRERVQRIMLSASWPESVRESEKILFIDRAQHRDDGLLHDLVLDRGNPQRALSAVRFGNVYPPGWRRPISSGMNLPMHLGYPLRENLLVLPPRHSVHTCRRILLETVEAVHH